MHARTLTAAALTAGLVGTGMLSTAPIAQATEDRQCIMLIRVYEDGSWGGTLAQKADGTVLAERWDVTHAPQQGTITPNEHGRPTYHTNFPPEIDGKRCQVWIDHRA